MAHVLDQVFAKQACMIVDGGLGTELAAAGHDLSSELWSARLLEENPEAIKKVHTDYYAAGADIGIAATYQASFTGFEAAGIGEAKATELMQAGMRVLVESRDAFWASIGAEANTNGRLKPLVAASVGSYGASLGNGAEYTGDYGTMTAEVAPLPPPCNRAPEACCPSLLRFPAVSPSLCRTYFSGTSGVWKSLRRVPAQTCSLVRPCRP